MNERENRIMRKQIIQCCELRQPRIGWNCGWPIAMRYNRHHVHHPPHRDRASDQRQKNDAEPSRPLPRNSELHTNYYVQFACGIS